MIDIKPVNIAKNSSGGGFRACYQRFTMADNSNNHRGCLWVNCG
jgi:hypothetical protein